MQQTAEAVVTVKPGDRLIFVWPVTTTPDEFQRLVAQTKDALGEDVRVLHVCGADQVVHLPAERMED